MIDLDSMLEAASEPPVGKTRVGDVEVSTIRLPFAGMGGTHETMLFCDDTDDRRHLAATQYSGSAEAAAGHEDAVAALSRGESLGWWA